MRCAEPPARCDSTAKRLISAAVSAMAEAMAPAGPGCGGRVVAGPGRARTSPPEDHRPVRGGRTADGRHRPRARRRVERLHLQLQGPAPRTVRARLPVLLPQRHRGAAQGATTTGATASSTGCSGCSRSRSSSATADGCCSDATGSASNRSTSPRTPSASGSRRRCPRCWPAAASTPASTPSRCTTT